MLKYLFVVEYYDGSVYEQSPEDISIVNPEKSAFADVSIDSVKKFYLLNDVDIISIDMETGVFSINGIEFGMFDEEIPIKLRRLVYFRRNWKKIVSGIENSMEVDGRTTFHIGWEGFTYDDKKVRRVIWVE